MVDSPQREKLSGWWAAAEPKLLRVARRYTPSPDVARELVQNVAVLVVKNFSRFTDPDELYRWACARLHWLALDQLRAGKHQSISLENIAEQPIPATQEQNVIAREIWKCISTLPPRQRAALEGMLEGHSTSAIAKDLGITEAGVRSLQRFARRKLATFLLEEENL